MKSFKKYLIKERKQRHNYIKLRGRTEASWSFTQYPLDVTKVLTIPWEFKHIKNRGGKKPTMTSAALQSLALLHSPTHQYITHFLSGMIMTTVSLKSASCFHASIAHPLLWFLLNMLFFFF